MSTYSGTIYEMGQQIPGVVSTIYTPHIWYDQSKNYKNGTNIFEDLFVAEGLTLGEEEDKIWNYDELLMEILQYLNLHIIQVGYDYYIFDWNTPRNEMNIEWLDIFTGDTKIDTFRNINITANMYGSDDTQITIDDVYNQIQVKDDIEKLETVIESPFNEDGLTALNTKQQYMTEYGTTGSDGKSFAHYAWLLRTDDASNISQDSQINSSWYDPELCWTRKWYMQVYKNKNWSFYKNNVDNYSVIPTDLDGKYYNCWMLTKRLFDEPFSSGIVGFGSGSKITNKNSANIENIEIKDKYICIAINGNGYDGVEGAYPVPSGTVIFPNDNDIENCGLKIDYNYPTDATYSPADPNVTNYLVFSGDILMTVPKQVMGIRGFRPHIYNDEFVYFSAYQDYYNRETLDANENRGLYVDYNVFYRSKNNFITAKSYIQYRPNQIVSGYDYRGCLSPVDGTDDKGAYYNQLFYKNRDGAELDNRDAGNIYVSPPIVYDGLDKRFNYSIDKKSVFDTDVIQYVDVLACQLRIGNKYCCEDHDSTGRKTFTWKTTDELEQERLYEVNPGGDIMYKAYIYLAINIDDGQYLIGESHPIYNNIDATMNVDKLTGMAIPMKNTDNLSGDLHFSIIGPVNNTWDGGIYRHKTWFRHSSITESQRNILPHVGQIWIKKFDVKLASDNGKEVINDENDIIYCSDEQRKFINKKDDIDFKFTTALTAAEASAMHVEYAINRSDVSDSDGIQILDINNTVTGETDKPEKHYVDAYYTEYCDPKIKVDTTLHNSNKINIFNKYAINYLNRTFYIQKTEYDVIKDKKKITFKEK